MDSLTYVTVRPPCPVEERTLVRHKFKFYNNVIVAGTYRLPVEINATRASSASTYVPALRACLEKHAFLCTILKENEKGRREYARVSHVDLLSHIHVIDQKVIHVASRGDKIAEDDIIARVLEYLHNDPDLTFFNNVTISPGWRMDVLPLQSVDQQQRVWLSFTYSHHVADGMSGIILHDTFLDALIHGTSATQEHINTVVETHEADLLKLPKLPISPSYLLGPALGHYLPSFLSKAFGLKASTSGSDGGTWTGQQTFLNSPSTSSSPPVTTAIEILSIKPEILTPIVKACRSHSTKLTSLLNGIIAQCMNHHLTLYSSRFHPKTNLIAVSATNIRTTCAIPADTVGVFASAAFTKYPLGNFQSTDASPIDPTISTEMWKEASINTNFLSRSVSSIQNQPVGLLAWISDFDTWMIGQMNQPRDVSWLLSNILTFNGRPYSSSNGRANGCEVEKMYFCACADGVGAPLDFNIVSVKGGELVICAGWQVGALDLDLGFDDEGGEGAVEEVERRFVKRLLEDLRRYLDDAGGD